MKLIASVVSALAVGAAGATGVIKMADSSPAPASLVVVGSDTLDPKGLSTHYRHLALRPLTLVDTIVPTYAIATDTVLGLAATYSVKTRKCGIGRWYFRLKVRDTVIHADTVELPVCATQWPVAGGSLSKTWSEIPCGFGDSVVIANLAPCTISKTAFDTLKIKSPEKCNWVAVNDSTLQCKSLLAPPAPTTTLRVAAPTMAVESLPAQPTRKDIPLGPGNQLNPPVLKVHPTKKP